MPNLSTAASLLIIIPSLLLIEVWCRDVSFIRQPDLNTSMNAWPKLSPHNNAQLPPWGPSSTTPWPALGGRPQAANPQSIPTWVRPTQGSKPNNPFGGVPQGTLSKIPPQSPNASQNAGPQFGSKPQETSGPANDDELREFSEVLLTKDVNNAAKYITVNFQGKTTSRSERDEAPEPLISVMQSALTIPSIEKLMLLYNNYVLESNMNEHYTAQEKIEESNLLDTILTTPIMQHTRTFLIEKGKLGRDPKEFKDILREIWFNMYSRGGGRIGSSGFEHVFLAEIKNNQISGLHNWLYFNEEEKKQQANYLGYLKKLDLGNRGAILKYHFKFHNIDKPVGSMFIGTSPEFEIALYTTCFLLRADQICPLKLNGQRFIIRTYTYRYRGKNMIGSAFPEI